MIPISSPFLIPYFLSQFPHVFPRLPFPFALIKIPESMIVPQARNYLPTMTSKTNLFRAELGEVTGRIPVTAAAEVAEAGAGLAATHSKDNARRGPSG